MADVASGIFAIFGTPTDYSFDNLKNPSVSSVTAAANISLMPWINHGSFVWSYIVPHVAIKLWNTCGPLGSANLAKDDVSTCFEIASLLTPSEQSAEMP